MHLSNLPTVQAKADYVIKKGVPLDRAFPTALTNKISLRGSTIDNIIKLVTFLDELNKESNQRLGYMIIDHQHDTKPTTPSAKQQYFKDLNRQASLRIQNIVNMPATHKYVQYERWHDYANKQSVVLFVNPNGSQTDTAKLKDYVLTLSDSSDDYRPADTQKLLNILIKLFLKLTLIHDLDYDDSTLSNGRVNLNNDIGFLVKTKFGAKKEGEDIADATDHFSATQVEKVLYHSLMPSVWLNSYGDLVVEVKYQRYKSIKHNPDIKESDCIDVYIPNALPAKYQHFGYRSASSDHYLVKEPANSGTRSLSFIELKAFNNSILHYEASIVRLLHQILDGAGISHAIELFDPNFRARPFKTLRLPKATDTTKPKLVIINAISKPVRKGRSTTANRYQPIINTYKTNARGKQIRFTKNDIWASFDFDNKDAIDAYIEYLRFDFFAAYDTEVINYKDVSYEDLDSDLSYIVLQDEAPYSGYWYFCDDEKAGKLKSLLGKKWLSKVGLGFKSENIPIQREPDFFKILHKSQRCAQDKPDTPFYTDPYTSLKLKQYAAAHSGRKKKNLQGHHLPALTDIGKALLNYEDYATDQSEIKLFVRQATEDRKKSTFDAALTKMEIDLTIKKSLATKGLLALYNNIGERADFSAYAGKYRCYYVIRPRIQGAGNKFFASQMDVTVSADGIIVDSTKLLTNESHIRSAEQFGISLAAHPNLYNDSFYMVNEVGDVLTCYTTNNVVRPLNCIPSEGRYKGAWTSDFISTKREDLERLVARGAKDKNDRLIEYSEGDDIPISKGTTNGAQDESAIFGFYAMASDGKESDWAYRYTNDDGKTIAYGGKEWLFLKELDSGILSMFLSNKQDINEAQSKANRVYNLLVKDANGTTLKSAESPMALLYIDTTTFHLARVNSFSAKSIFHAMTKMVLRD